MRRVYILIFMLAIITMTSYAQKNKIVARTKGSITFVVDEKLTSNKSYRLLIMRKGSHSSDNQKTS